jgi:hypothetical protein
MIPKEQWEAWALALSGARVQEDIADLTRYHRIPGSQQYYQALEMVRKRFQQAGFESPEIIEYPADGEFRAGMWRSENIWELRNASLEILSPEKAKGILIDAKVSPIAIATRSAATPPHGIEADIIDVGEGKSLRDFTAQIIKGQIILSKPGTRMWTLGIAEYGAAGVLSSPAAPGKIDHPDLIDYSHLPGYLLKGKSAFAFKLSERQYRQLKDLVAKQKANNQKVRARVIVDTEFREGTIPIFSAWITGQKLPNQEIILVAHLCHPKPSANDNASGVATVLELARVWKRLIDMGSIPPPLRTVRFLLLPEWRGSIPWVQKEIIEKQRTVIAAFSLDMVGADQEKVGSRLTFDETPLSLPSFLNDRMEAALSRAAKEPICQVGYPPTPFRWERVGFQGGSDHLPFVHPWAQIPALCLTEWPDRYYHSSGDTVDKTNPVVIHRTALAVAQVTTELTLAQTLAAESFRLQTAWAGQQRLIQFAKDQLESAVTQIRGLKNTRRRKVGEIWRDITLALTFHLNVERKALNSPISLVPESDQKAFEQHGDDLLWEVDNLGQRLKDHLRVSLLMEAKTAGVDIRRLRTWTPRPDQWIAKAKSMVPTTTFQGPFSYIDFMKSMDDHDLEWFVELEDKGEISWHFFGALEQLCTWMDGKKTLWEIHRLQNYTDLTLSLQSAVEFVQMLQKQGWVTLQKTN